MRNGLLVLCSLLACMLAQAQEKAGKVPEPEYMNEMYFLADSNSLKVLEKGDAVMKTKTKLGGFGGSSSEYIVEGPAAALRTSNTTPTFVMKMDGMMMMDPSRMMILYKFDKKEKQRSAILSKVGAMGAGSTNNQEGIRYHVKKNSEGVCIFMPDKPLEPGEYGFVNMMMPTSTGSGRNASYSYSVYTFGIDK